MDSMYLFEQNGHLFLINGIQYHSEYSVVFLWISMYFYDSMIVSFPSSYSWQLHINGQVVNGELNQQPLWPQAGLRPPELWAHHEVMFPLSPSFLFAGFNHSNGFQLGSNEVSHAPHPVLGHLKLFIRIRSCSQTKRGVNVEERRSLNGTDRTQQLSSSSSSSRVAIMMSRAAACENVVC